MRDRLKLPIDPPACEKCGQPTRLVTVIQRLGPTPGYRIFQCDGCNVLQWVETAAAGNSARQAALENPADIGPR